MTRYILKRLCEAVPVFFAIVTAVFFMVRFVPGGPFDRERPVSQETIEALNAYYGLDEPLAAQYFKFLGNLARGELGPSYKSCAKRRRCPWNSARTRWRWQSPQE